MVHSTAICWKIGLAVFAAALPFWQLPALADDGKADKVEPRPQPVEAKSVRIILQPPANDAVFALRPPRPAAAVGTVSTQPAGDAAGAPPRPEPVKPQEDAAVVDLPSLSEQSRQIALQPPDSNAAPAQPRPEPAKLKEDALVVAPPSSPERSSQIVLQPAASNVAPDQPRPEPAKLKQDAAFVTSPSSAERSSQIALQPPASNVAPASPRPEPVKLKEDAAFVASPSSAERSLQVALQPPASNAASVRPRPDPAKIRKDATSAPIPSLPERRPFRPVLANIEPGEKEQNAALASQKQTPEPASFLAKVNSAFKPLTNLWPGNQKASEAASPTAEASDRSTASPASADPGPASDKTDGKQEQGSFLKSLRFW